MKHILLLCVLSLLPAISFSQEKYSDYTLDYFSKTYDVKIGEPDRKGVFRVFVDIQCTESFDRSINFMINSDKIDAFVESVKQAKMKYAEWRQVAMDNKVDKLNKDIDISFPYVGVGFVYGEWHFDFSVKPSSRFLVLDGDRYLMILDTGNVVASDNQFMETEGYVVFSNVEEIDSFISNLDLVKMQQFINKKSSTESLFE